LETDKEIVHMTVNGAVHPSVFDDLLSIWCRAGRAAVGLPVKR
jgi:hypothetical protein